MATIKRKGNFTTVTNKFIRNTEISFKAKGIFAYMASFSDEWNFTIKSMATQSKDGYDSIKTAIQELKDLGYIEYEKFSDGTGTYTLYDEPKTENPKMDNPIKGKSTPIKKKQLTKNNNTKKESEYVDFLNQLEIACKYKTKVSKTNDGEKIFKGIEDKGKLFDDYVAHQLDKENFSVRITAYMKDYLTVYSSEAKSSEKKTDADFWGGN